MNRLAGKVAVITGGCSGIGRATMERFVEEGAHVLVADVQTSAFDEVAKTHGDKILCRKCDVTDDNDIAAAMHAAVDAWGDWTFSSITQDRAGPWQGLTRSAPQSGIELRLSCCVLLPWEFVMRRRI